MTKNKQGELETLVPTVRWETEMKSKNLERLGDDICNQQL